MAWSYVPAGFTAGAADTLACVTFFDVSNQLLVSGLDWRENDSIELVGKLLKQLHPSTQRE
jgi:hypothetical protein